MKPGRNPDTEKDLFDPEQPCRGCRDGNIRHHNGMYCRIRDWKSKGMKKQRFVDLIGR